MGLLGYRDATMSDDFNDDPDRAIVEWKQRISSGPTVRVEVERVFYGGKATTIDVVDELLDEDDVRERYGGGKYLLKAKRPDKNGRMVCAACATMDIAGDPRDQTPPRGHENAKDAQLRSVIEELVREHLKTIEKRLLALERKSHASGR